MPQAPVLRFAPKISIQGGLQINVLLQTEGYTYLEIEISTRFRLDLVGTEVGNKAKLTLIVFFKISKDRNEDV